MIELIQIPYSPYCLVQKRILEFSGTRYRCVNIPNGDRSLVWKLTRQRYYQVPILKDGRTVVFETDEHSQVIAKYLDEELDLGLFPHEWSGVQMLLWRYFEGEIEGVGFKLNDIHYQQNVPKADQLPFLRHKERRFGKGCLEQWKTLQPQLLEQLATLLVPCEEMLFHRPYLLGDRPLFVDFDLYGMLANFLYSGNYQLPTAHSRLADWHQRMSKITLRQLK